MTQRAWLIAAATALMAGGTATRAAAQRDSTIKNPPGDTTAAKPISEAEAVAAGVKLLGVFNASTGDWIDRAVVRDTLGNQILTSNIGIGALSALEPVLGQYLIEIRKEGYAPQHFKLRADTAAEFLVSLVPNPLGEATRLPAVIATDSRRMLAEDAGEREGFFARCSMAVVECVGRSDLNLHPTATIADLLDRKEGILLYCPTVKRAMAARTMGTDQIPTCIAQMKSTNGGSCSPTYFVNGFPWTPLAGSSSQQQLDQFVNPSNISGIEVYLSLMPRPARYEMPKSQCGAVVIWTH